MDANAHPNHDLERVIKFIFGEAPEPFWFRGHGLGGRIFGPSKNLVDGIGKNEGLSISIGREAVSIHSSSAIGKYQSFKKPEFYDLFKITLLVISV